MSNKRRKVIVTKDVDNFTESSCDCPLCTDMNKAARSTDHKNPTNNIQKRLLTVITKYEKKSRKRERSK
jgi:hypothetical protein